jgi:phospholipase C
MDRRQLLIGAAAGLAVTAGGLYFGHSYLRTSRQPAPKGKTGTPIDNIDTIVVVMLENRSFDNLLGSLYPRSSKFEGLQGNESNRDLSGTPVLVNNVTPPGADSGALPGLDPGELWDDINEQIFGTKTPSPNQPATMEGFVQNFLRQPNVQPDQFKDLSQRIMHCYKPEQVPVLSDLARQFAVCDHWFASAPCETWPNRFFTHTGTADGFENNEPYHFLENTTIFERITATLGQSAWAIYYHDYPLSLNLTRLALNNSLNFLQIQNLYDDAKAGTLPAYSFIEPRYLPDVEVPNDQHPPHGIAAGETLIADVYNALRASPHWQSSLLLIVYDEHGGCYDHVPPPKAARPDDAMTSPFAFDRYGVRVPAVIVSPFIKSGSILRAPGGAPFDHTSIISTLTKRFDLGAPLTHRDAAAPDLGSVSSIWMSKAENSGPNSIIAPSDPNYNSRLQNLRNQPVSELQRSLLHIHSNLTQAQSVQTDKTARQATYGKKGNAYGPMSAGDAAKTVKPLPDILKQMSK